MTQARGGVGGMRLRRGWGLGLAGRVRGGAYPPRLRESFVRSMLSLYDISISKVGIKFKPFGMFSIWGHDGVQIKDITKGLILPNSNGCHVQIIPAAVGLARR